MTAPLILLAAILTADLETGTLPAKWITGGPNCIEVPDWQVHQYNANFFILRQSGCVDYEKPFLYAIFGNDTVALVDTGSGKDNGVAKAFDTVVERWLKANNRASIRKLVFHSHAHGDHIAGDPQFSNRSDIEFIPPTLDAIRERFRLADWPNATSTVDLGNRILDIIPIPGHHTTDIAVYDTRTGILLTGDTVYPGRLYITDWAEFERSITRLVAFTATRPVAHILGCHIEQSATPFVDYPVGTRHQPDEHSLPLARAHLLEIQQTLAAQQGKPERIALRDLTLYPRTPRRRNP
jgi:glyoxylase-like metal-dependent hydrolase (beta-lactamase superfamily II)